MFPVFECTQIPAIMVGYEHLFFRSADGGCGVALRIEITKHGAGPVIVCDHCGERITNALEGNYEWAGVTTTPGERLAIYFLHKRCSAAFERRQGIILDSMELTVMLPYLAKNLQLNWEQAWTQAETMSEL